MILHYVVTVHNNNVLQNIVSRACFFVENSGMKILIDFLRAYSIHGRRMGKLVRLCITDRLQGTERAEQRFAPGRTDPFDLIQE